MFSDQEIVFFDVETSGLDPVRHQVIQFAGAAVNYEFEILEEIEVKVKFDPNAADADALAKNRYDPETWKREAVDEGFALRKIADFTRRRATLTRMTQRPPQRPYTVARMCHNARFDAEFIAAWYKRAGLFFPGACYEALCTLNLARWATLSCGPGKGPEDHRLETLCRWLGIPLDEAHDALADVRATVEVARVLTGRLRIEGWGSCPRLPAVVESATEIAKKRSSSQWQTTK